MVNLPQPVRGIGLSLPGADAKAWTSYEPPPLTVFVALRSGLPESVWLTREDAEAERPGAMIFEIPLGPGTMPSVAYRYTPDGDKRDLWVACGLAHNYFTQGLTPTHAVRMANDCLDAVSGIEGIDKPFAFLDRSHYPHAFLFHARPVSYPHDGSTDAFGCVYDRKTPRYVKDFVDRLREEFWEVDVYPAMSLERTGRGVWALRLPGFALLCEHWIELTSGGGYRYHTLWESTPDGLPEAVLGDDRPVRFIKDVVKDLAWRWDGVVHE